jgi:hypothetical protein
MERGEKGRRGRSTSRRGGGGRGVRAVQQRARLLQSKLNPPTQLLRYTYLEELKLKITPPSPCQRRMLILFATLCPFSNTFLHQNE